MNTPPTLPPTGNAQTTPVALDERAARQQMIADGIAEAQKKEQQFRQSLTRMQAILDHVPGGGWRSDVGAAAKQWAAERLHARSPEMSSVKEVGGHVTT